MMGTVTTHGLGYETGSTTIDRVLPLVFGELARMVIPVMTHYQSDLYHDALWLAEQGKGQSEFVFYFSFNDTGTDIASVPTYMHREHKYRVTVRNVDGSAAMEVELWPASKPSAVTN